MLSKNQIDAEIPVVKNNLSGKETMQDILSAFIICSLILSSPFVVDVKDPLARTTPALPLVDNLYKICCSHAKLALFFGGIPYFHLGSPSKVLFHHTF